MGGGDSDSKAKLLAFDPGFSNSLDPFDEQVEELAVESYFYKIGDDFSSVTTVEAGRKSFSHLKGRPESLMLDSFARRSNDPKSQNPDFWFFSTPFPLSFDLKRQFFTPVEDLVWAFAPEGGQRMVKDLGKGRYEVQLSGPPTPYFANEGTLIQFVVTAEIDSARGYLPTKLKTNRMLVRHQDKTFSSNNDLGGIEVQLRIKEFEQGGFYIQRAFWETTDAAMEYPLDPELRTGKAKRLVWDLAHPPQPEDEYPARTVSMEVVSLTRWQSHDPATFSPKCPPGVGFFNNKTGQMEMDGEAIQQLKLNLEAGDRPIGPNFRTISEQMTQKRKLFTVIFWSGVGITGIAIVYLSRRYQSPVN